MSQLLSWTQRKRLYERAAAQLENRRTLPDILKEYQVSLERRKRMKSASAVYDIWRKVRNGDTLVRAMGAGLTDRERSLLDAGERIGKLPLVMQLILEIRERTGDMKWKLMGSMFPPVVYLVSIYLTLFVVGSTALQPFLDSIPLSKWTGWAYALYLMGEFAVSWVGPTMLALLAIAGVAGVRALPRWTGEGRIKGRAFFDRYIFGFAEYRELVGFEWLLSYAALVRAKVPDATALADQIKTASPWLASRLRPIQIGIRNGLKLDDAMRRSGLGFPSLDLIDEIGAYVGTPDFPERIEAVARAYAKRLERALLVKIVVTTAVFSVVMFMIMGIIQLGSNELSSLLTSSMGGGMPM
ncbi:type II secretion system F family protein [Paraburkholderia sp. BR10872]|uniref:type II secretion system F family protein n=1 Tax=Paraburkholderia sp. BR10872 TaxID=3236989 RepID=UPI0034D27FE4